MLLDETMTLTTAEQDRFFQRGYHFPVHVLDATEASHYRRRFLDHRNRNRQRPGTFGDRPTHSRQP
jgi:hypothetical protein